MLISKDAFGLPLILATLFEHGAITLIEDRRIAFKCLEMLQIRIRERERGANGDDVTILIG